MRVGFTGTRQGTTCEQHKALADWFKANAAEVEEFHHGCCLGADAEAAEVATSFGRPVVHGHPSNSGSWTNRAALYDADVKYPKKPPLDRNKDIVDACDLLLACPKDDDEGRVLGGTGHTIRYARKQRKPVIIFWPDGRVTDDAIA